MSGRIAKRHLNAFLVAARREFGPFEYFWVLEFQSRGAVHFHLATTLPPPNALERERFAVIWARIAKGENWTYSRVVWEDGELREGALDKPERAIIAVHSHPKAWEAVRKDDGMQRYMAKYAQKLRQKIVPPWYQDVGRFWGVSRGVKLPEGKPFHGTETEVREVLAQHGRFVENWEVLPKIVLV